MERVYDVVIVGAGVAGAIVAKQLAKAGRTVLILEAGTGAGLTSDGYQSFVETYQSALIKVPNSAYPNNPNAPQPYVNDTLPLGTSATNSNGYFVQLGPHPFASTNTRSAGGTTLHWLGTCLRMLPTDFTMRSTYGHGVDWPIDYNDMQRWYRLAEEEIGVSANVAEQVAGIPDGHKVFAKGYEYPMHKIPQSYLDDQLAAGVQGLRVPMGHTEHDVRVVSTPQGRNSTPNATYPGPDLDHPKSPLGYRPVGAPYGVENHVGERCEGNSSCIPICPVQAKYTAVRTMGTMGDAVAARVTVQVRSVASTVTYADNGQVTGVVYKRYTSPDRSTFSTHTAKGRTYVIAAHAVESAKILLASKAARTSGQVGRNLMDHPTILTWGTMPSAAGSYRGPGSTSGIAGFRDGSFRLHHSGFRVEIGNWGWNWAAAAPNSTVSDLLSPSKDKPNTPYGVAFRQQLYDQCQRHMRLAFLVEQTPMESNRVELDPQFTDALGNFRPVIRYDFDDYTKRGMKAAVRVSNAIFGKVGIKDFTKFDANNASYLIADGQPVIAYGAGHIVGTHRMGRTPRDSVTDADMRCWDHQNLFVVGCGSMPTIGTSNPTLTMAALAFKAADAITRDLDA